MMYLYLRVSPEKEKTPNEESLLVRSRVRGLRTSDRNRQRSTAAGLSAGMSAGTSIELWGRELRGYDEYR